MTVRRGITVYPQIWDEDLGTYRPMTYQEILERRAAYDRMKRREQEERDAATTPQAKQEALL